jgi:hypothetical protein
MRDDWLDAGRPGELAPGRMKRIDHRGRLLLLANVDGRFYATGAYPVRLEGERVLVGLGGAERS